MCVATYSLHNIDQTQLLLYSLILYVGESAWACVMCNYNGINCLSHDMAKKVWERKVRINGNVTLNIISSIIICT